MHTAFCPLAAVAMRGEPSHRAEMVNQLLFGDAMWITDGNDEWLKVKLFYDDYEGWVSAKQLLVTDTLPSCNSVATRPTTIFFGNSPLTIQPGSSYDRRWLVTAEPQQEEARGDDPVAVARQWLGAPYLWGGRTMMGVDCSGLTQVTYKICGAKLMRDASMQVQQGEPVSFEERRSGDLAFFENEKGKIIHVGIVMDEGKIIHASGKVRIDTLDDKGILNSDSHQYSHRLSKVRRMVECRM